MNDLYKLTFLFSNKLGISRRTAYRMAKQNVDLRQELQKLPPGGKYLKVSDVAARLGVTKDTIYRWIDSGKLAAHRLGGTTIRVLAESVQQLIEEIDPDAQL